jgi:hypothetical protein
MTPQGTLILLALADQKWPFAFAGEWLRTWSPHSKKEVRIPLAWMEDPDQKRNLGLQLLDLVVTHGLRWEDDPRGGFSFLN